MAKLKLSNNRHSSNLITGNEAFWLNELSQSHRALSKPVTLDLLQANYMNGIFKYALSKSLTRMSLKKERSTSRGDMIIL